MKKKLTKTQTDTLKALKESRWGSLQVGPGMVERRTADALVRKGYCQYAIERGWGDQPSHLVIRLKEEE